VSVTSGGENSPATLYYGVRNTTEVCERFAPLHGLARSRRRFVLVAVHLLQALRPSRKREGVEAVLQGWATFAPGASGNGRCPPSSVSSTAWLRAVR
jgi:hypothetical protein